MTDHQAQVAQVLRAVAITSPTTYAWFGRRSRPLPAAVKQVLPADSARAYLVEQLEQELYRSFYTQGSPVPVSPDEVGPDRPDEDFVAGLSRANAGAGGWDAGWRVREEGRGGLIVEKKGLRVRARASDCRPADGGRTADDAVSVRRPKELLSTSPGFYTALGDRALAVGDEDVELRVYFNVTAVGAASVVAVCTRLLNDARIPFSLKVVDRPGGFTRCDAAVLYLGNTDFVKVRRSLSAIISECAPYLGEDTPGFTKPLTPGVAVGEHRRSLGASFGTCRCRLVAEGLVAAYEQGTTRLPHRLDAVVRRFADSGLDLDAPYLAPASTSVYAL